MFGLYCSPVTFMDQFMFGRSVTDTLHTPVSTHSVKLDLWQTQSQNILKAVVTDTIKNS